VILTKEHVADVNSRVQNDEMSPGEAYKLLQRIQLDKDSYCPTTAEDKIEMVRLYTEQMLSCKQIGQRFKCHEETVRYHLNLQNSQATFSRPSPTCRDPALTPTPRTVSLLQ
jgi:hypothetical protein